MQIEVAPVLAAGLVPELVVRRHDDLHGEPVRLLVRAVVEVRRPWWGLAPVEARDVRGEPRLQRVDVQLCERTVESLGVLARAVAPRRVDGLEVARGSRAREPVVGL